ncbi:response regulator receiver protein [Thiocapsa imhoffii]|uniref:Response regulator receiver protein n=1 Tax=Thiocapsa imhoffii TaxID=382777 RepID=A0A9X0WF25_9GAMM|nr:EAL domain-containing protein [Thiocapsa imhoffii]MBK1643331.1 response regulator receiver protein [Thiocapsa imhoffii]
MNEAVVTTTDNQVFYFGDDAVLCMGVAAQIQPRGLKLESFEHLDEIERRLAEGRPRVLILDLRCLTDDLSPTDLIARLRAEDTSTAILCLAEEDSINTRLQVMRAGAAGYFPAPVDPIDVAKRIIASSGLERVKAPKILVVEDDLVQAKYIELLLTGAGMQPHLVNEPLQIMERMREVQPDLVLMDLYLPGATGAELTAVIRDHAEFFDTPVIFLSAETDPDKQLDALKVGGDSFISKPVKREQLIGSIEHRIRMSRWLREHRVKIDRHDAPQGVLPREAFMQRLDRLVHDRTPMSEGTGLLVIELDRPEQILEALGVQNMERLLRRLQGQFAEQLQPQECAARFDDIAFVVLARRDEQADLDALSAHLLKAVAATNLRAGGQRIPITATIGIGLFIPAADDAITMLSRSRTALLKAKHEGGNRVRFWKPLVSPGSGLDYDQVVCDLVRHAITGDGLVLMFQPIVSLGTNVGELYEVQLRLRTPHGEEIPAADFLPVAERAGLMPQIDRWVLENALDVMNARRSKHPRLRLLIHQTIESIATRDWLPWFREQMVQRNLIRRRPLLQFQIHDVREHLEATRKIVAILRKYGIQVCIANVSGLAADLELVSDLSVSLAKLSFATLLNSEQAELTRVVEQLRAGGTSVIAAGIEDPETIARVWNCKPDFIQGNSLQMPSSELIYDFHDSTDDL